MFDANENSDDHPAGGVQKDQLYQDSELDIFYGIKLALIALCLITICFFTDKYLMASRFEEESQKTPLQKCLSQVDHLEAESCKIIAETYNQALKDGEATEDPAQIMNLCLSSQSFERMPACEVIIAQYEKHVEALIAQSFPQKSVAGSDK